MQLYPPKRNYQTDCMNNDNFFSFFVSFHFSLFSQFLIEWIKVSEQEGHLIRAFSLQSVQLLNPMVSHYHLSFIHSQSRGWGVYRGPMGVESLQPVRVVSSGREVYQLPTPRRVTGKRRQQGGLPACNDNQAVQVSWVVTHQGQAKRQAGSYYEERREVLQFAAMIFIIYPPK